MPINSRRRTTCWRLGLTLLWLTVLCAGTGRLHAQTVDYVLHISVDGLHAGQLQSLLQTSPDRYPNFQRFVQEGATTFNARNDAANTYTLPNHATMISGRPVSEVGDDAGLHHGYTSNSTPESDWTLHNHGNPAVDYVTSTFDVAHDYGLRTALYTGKDKFSIFEQSYNVTEETPGGRPDAYLANGDQGRSKIDRYYFEVVHGTSSGLLAAIEQDFAEQPAHYTFFHFLEPDVSGHAFGWRSPEWNQSVAEVDEGLGRLFALVGSNPQMQNRTSIVLTSDHGGTLLRHEPSDGRNVYQVPFFAWGPNVAVGQDLYDLNPLTRRDPGEDWLSYEEPMQPVRNGDSANLAMSLLGLPAVDGSSINLRQDLRVDLPQTAMWDGDVADRGAAGDGTRWLDQRNWTRANLVDQRIQAGDVVRLPATLAPTVIDLESDQAIDSLSVGSDYQLINGSLNILTGHVDVDADAELTVTGDLRSPRGVFKLGEGALQMSGGIIDELFVSAGVVRGRFAVQGSVATRGIIAPGDESGDLGIATLPIAGYLTMTAAGSLEMQLAADGVSDRIEVGDRVIYRGTMNLNSLEGAMPTERGEFNRWTLITSERQLGTFYDVTVDGFELQANLSSTNDHAGGGLFHQLEYSNSGLQLTSYLAIPGDVNGDGMFNTQDLVSVFTDGGYENGQTDDADWTSGDWSGDGDFTTIDLVVAFSYGAFEQPSVLPASNVHIVPEPAGHGLVWLATLSTWVISRRGRHHA